MKQKILSILFLALAALTANAQDDFNPTLPGEPNAHYWVTVSISNEAAGSVSGGGSFPQSQQITISRNDAYFSPSSTVFYRFKCWKLNGREYTEAGTATSFPYTVGTENAAFEAVYEAVDPDNVTSRLFLVAEPADACTFNQTSGQRHFEDNYASLYYQPTSEAFRFLGWYEGDQLITTDPSLSYYIGKEDATLTARFSYEPVIPGDPTSTQENVANGIKGDVNGDGKVTVADAVAVMDYYIHRSEASDLDATYDVNGDGRVTVADAVEIMNIYLTQ